MKLLEKRAGTMSVCRGLVTMSLCSGFVHDNDLLIGVNLLAFANKIKVYRHTIYLALPPSTRISGTLSTLCHLSVQWTHFSSPLAVRGSSGIGGIGLCFFGQSL